MKKRIKYSKGILSTNDIGLQSFLNFHPSNENAAVNKLLLDAFPNKPYKSAKRKAIFVSEIINNLHEQGITFTPINK